MTAWPGGVAELETGTGPGAGPVSLTVQLLGRPQLVTAEGTGYRFRSRKSWALLAYLVLSERPPTRSRMASLLFGEADDPIRALRWSLSEIRSGLGDRGVVDGDPVVLRLAPGTVVDVDVLRNGTWSQAVELAGLGADLLDGVAVPNAPAFATWLLSEQRHLAAATEAVLHEAALGSMSRGELDAAVRYAVRAAAMSPLDENHQALVIRLYRLIGDDAAAERQYAACRELFERELGVPPGEAVEAARREMRQAPGAVDEHTLEALVEAGAAAVAAGAREAGVQSLRTAARLAGEDRPPALRVASRLVLAEALIHALGGLDEEGVAALAEADEIALRHGLAGAVAEARCELGYVDFLRARYDRARRWLIDALARAGQASAVAAKATTYLGTVESDRGDYAAAVPRLSRAVTLSRAVGDPRREAFALSMIGRVDLLRGDLDAAAGRLDASIALAASQGWLALLPWPQALLRRGPAGQGRRRRRRPDPRAGVRPCLPARRPLLGGHLRTRAGARGRGGRRQRRGLPDPGRGPATCRPAGRPLRVARRVHPRRAVHPRPAARAPRHPALGGRDERPDRSDGDARAGAPVAAPRSSPGRRRVGRGRGPAGPRDRQPCARGFARRGVGHLDGSTSVRSISLSTTSSARFVFLSASLRAASASCCCCTSTRAACHADQCPDTSAHSESAET